MIALDVIHHLIITSVKDIRHDLVTNIISPFPIVTIVSPETFSPPFIQNFRLLTSAEPTSHWSVSIITVVCVFADIVYGLLRLVVAFLLCGITLIFQLGFIVSLSLFLAYRWEILQVDNFSVNLVS